MKTLVRDLPQWGRVLWMCNDVAEVGVALDFGLRIVHISCIGMENLFYVQPNDLSDGFVESNGWRLYGGHRMWLAPESKNSYYPDNAPIRYTTSENSVLFQQETDPLMGINKSICVTFMDDGGIRIDHRIQNATDNPMTGAAWGVNTLDAGGRAEIDFTGGPRGDYNPSRVVSLWADTNLHDYRLQFTKDKLIAQHGPSKDYFKIGLYSRNGRTVFQNKGQTFTLSYAAEELERYPDFGCNFELYMNKYFMELETLGCQKQILPGESVEHTEIWHLTKSS